MSGVWGTITDSEWTDNDARVVCRKLGHFRAGVVPVFVLYIPLPSDCITVWVYSCKLSPSTAVANGVSVFKIGYS